MMPDTMRTEQGRSDLLAAAECTGRARDHERQAGNDEMAGSLNSLTLALFALAIRYDGPTPDPRAVADTSEHRQLWKALNDA